jgi:FimV-like protein
MFIRSIGFVVSIAVLWFPVSSFAIGLGDLTVESRLASPLKARVIVNGIKRINIDPELLVIKLDSKTSASTPKLYYRLEPSNGDTTSILIYTRTAVMTPLFDFRLLVDWADGSIVRSYNVFIDPPAYEFETASGSGESNLPGQGPIAVTEVSEVVPTTIAVDSSTQSQPVSGNDSFNTAVSQPLENKGQTYGPIVSGNSLWRVAENVKSDNESLSMYQWMHGIWKENPEAFTQLNMHRLRIDALLSIPLEQEIFKISHTLAYQVFAEHLSILNSAQAKNKNIVPKLSQVKPEAMTVVPVDPIVAGESPVGASIAVNDEPEVELPSAVIEAAAEADDQNKVIDDLLAITELAGQQSVEEETELIATANNATDINAIDQKDLTTTTTLEDDLTVANVSMAASSTPSSQTLDAGTGISIISNEASGFVDNSVRGIGERLSVAPSWMYMMLGSLVTLILLALVRVMRGKPEPATINPVKTEVIDRMLPVESKTILTSIADPDSDTSQPHEDMQADNAVTAKTTADVKNLLLEADVLVAYGDTEAAVSMLSDAIAQYPNESEFGLHLLKLFYMNRKATAFDRQFEKMLPVMANLDANEQVHWQLKLNDLCPDSTSILINGPLEGEEITAVVASGRSLKELYDSGDMVMNEHSDVIEIPPVHLETINIKPDSVETTELLSIENETGIEWNMVNQESEDILEMFGFTDSENDRPSNSEDEVDHLLEVLTHQINQSEVLAQAGNTGDSIDSTDVLDAYESTVVVESVATSQINLNEDTLEFFGFSDDDAKLSELVDAAIVESEESGHSDRMAGQDDLTVLSDAIQNDSPTEILDAVELPDEVANLDDDHPLEIDESLEFYQLDDTSFDDLPDEVGDLVQDEEGSDITGADGKTPNPSIPQFNGRILHFREKTNPEEKTNEFEVQMMDTLQAMRDQMQQMNERLFSQERENIRLRKALEDLSSGTTPDQRDKA